MDNTLIPEEIKKKIINKKELSGLNPSFLDDFLKKYFDKYKTAKAELEKKEYNEKSKEFKELKKHIRKKLREVHGAFKQKNKNKTPQTKEELIKFLGQHKSTKERIDTQQEIYLKVFKQKNINVLDLGCGFNPLFFLLSSNKINCTAVDINEEELKQIKETYKNFNRKIETIQLDLTEQKNIQKISELSKNKEFTLMLKLLDSLETKVRGTTTKLLKELNTKEIVVSFATKTIGGKKEIKGKRHWFERAINESKYEIKYEFETDNEKYYVLKQKNSKE